MAAATHAVLPPEARRLLDERARRERVTVSRAVAEIVCAALGVDPGPRPDRTYARDALPDVVRLACGDGGVTVARTAEALSVSDATARNMLNKARAAGMVTARRGARQRVAGGAAALVFRATPLGRGVAGAE